MGTAQSSTLPPMQTTWVAVAVLFVVSSCGKAHQDPLSICWRLCCCCGCTRCKTESDADELLWHGRLQQTHLDLHNACNKPTWGNMKRFRQAHRGDIHIPGAVHLSCNRQGSNRQADQALGRAGGWGPTTQAMPRCDAACTRGSAPATNPGKHSSGALHVQLLLQYCVPVVRQDATMSCCSSSVKLSSLRVALALTRARAKALLLVVPSHQEPPAQ